MKTIMKLVKYLVLTLTITAFTASCQKDNLEDAVIPQTTQVDGTDGQNGINGVQGEKGPKGDKGDQGEPGVAGPEGPIGPSGEDGEAIGVPGPKGDTGTAGAAGADGTNGVDGIDGIDGLDGADGTNGVDGVDGANGADGNANVRTLSYNMSDKSGASIPTTVPELTEAVLSYDLILGYLSKSGGGYSPIPSPIYAFSLNDNYDIAVDLAVGKYWMHFYEVGTENLKSVSAGKMNHLKIIIAKTGSATLKRSGKSDLLKDMKSKGVDISNYDDVMDYFGLEH